MAGLVGKKYKHKNDDRIEEIEVLQEAAMDKVFARTTFKKEHGGDVKLDTYSLAVLEEK